VRELATPILEGAGDPLHGDGITFVPVLWADHHD
jgi:hypothetical protein